MSGGFGKIQYRLARPATKVVAASNTSAESKSQADYICDGIADDVEIQAAIDAVPSGGGTVLLSEGTFTLANRIQVSTDVTLEGQGALCTILKLANGTNTNILENSNQSAGNSGINIRRLKLDGNKANQSSNGIGIDFRVITDVWIEEVYVLDVLAQGINFVGGSQVRISRVLINNCGNDGIVFNGTHTFICSDSLVINAEHSGFNSYNGAYRGIFNACIAYNSGYSGFVMESTSTSATVDISFVNCQSWNNGHEGFAISKTNAGDLQSRRFSIVGGVVRFNSRHGIKVYGSDYGTITGVVIGDNSQETDNTYDGIRLEGDGTYNTVTVTIRGCMIWGTSAKKERYGISENNANYNTIIGNEISGVGTDEILKAGADTIVRSNRGYITENSGTATVANATTSIAVNHGLASTPTRVLITCTGWGNASKAWVTGKGATQFTINVDADPGVATATFDWRAVVGEGN